MGRGQWGDAVRMLGGILDPMHVLFGSTSTVLLSHFSTLGMLPWVLLLILVLSSPFS